MKRPDFQEKTEVKVIDRKLGFLFGQRGKVLRLIAYVDGNEYDAVADKEKIRDAYLAGKADEMIWAAEVQIDSVCHLFSADQIEAVQHKFIDIDYIREDDLVIGKKADGTDAIRPKNTGCFEPGDIIQISTKIDGANASIAWDETTGKLEIFSRTNLLDSPGALRGFYDYIKTEVEPKIPWAAMSKKQNLVIFGEWCVKHSVKYNDDWYGKWRIYDVWDKADGCYWTQDIVRAFCLTHGLEYIEELYYGPFISWDHCRSFLHTSKAYGPDQEGIVIKNQTKLGKAGNKAPAYIKIVNEAFKESQHSKKPPKEIDPEAEAAKQKAIELASSIVTEARVRKHILKLIDEGKLPETLSPKDMGSVMKQLPKLIYDDCLKEEMDIVKQIGEGAGKFISAETAKWARRIAIGG